MSAETDLYAALSGDAGVTLLAETRIYPDYFPEKEEGAYIVYQRADTEIYTTIHSAAIAAQSATLTIQCYAEGRDDVEALTNAVLAALPGNNFVVTSRSAAYVSELKRHVEEISVIHNS
jgi:hypothetical protein